MFFDALLTYIEDTLNFNILKILKIIKSNILIMLVYKHSLEKTYEDVQLLTAEYNDIYEWIEKNCKLTDVYFTKRLYTYNILQNSQIVSTQKSANVVFHFKNKDDAMKFKLTWGYKNCNNKFIKINNNEDVV